MIAKGILWQFMWYNMLPTATTSSTVLFELNFKDIKWNYSFLWRVHKFCNYFFNLVSAFLSNDKNVVVLCWRYEQSFWWNNFNEFHEYFNLAWWFSLYKFDRVIKRRWVCEIVIHLTLKYHTKCHNVFFKISSEFQESIKNHLK